MNVIQFKQVTNDGSLRQKKRSALFVLIHKYTTNDIVMFVWLK